MQHRDQAPQQDCSPPSPDLEQVFRSLRAAGARPVIRTASAHQLRRALSDSAGHLCYRAPAGPDRVAAARPGIARGLGNLRRGVRNTGRFPALPSRRPGHRRWLPARHRVRPAPGSRRRHLLHQLRGALASASRQRMRGLLLDLAVHIKASMNDGDTSATFSTRDGPPSRFSLAAMASPSPGGLRSPTTACWPTAPPSRSATATGSRPGR
jgi:hypothetical protein